MFVCSLKTTPGRLAAVMGCLVLTLTLIGAAVLLPRADREVAAAGAVAAETTEQQLTYLRSLGYTVAEKPTSIEEILIPDEADPTFTAYNALQQQAGFDLTGYHGKRLKCFSYPVSTEEGETATAHLYIYRGRLVGGDVAFGTAGSDMRPLTKRQTQED